MKDVGTEIPLTKSLKKPRDNETSGLDIIIPQAQKFHNSTKSIEEMQEESKNHLMEAFRPPQDARNSLFPNIKGQSGSLSRASEGFNPKNSHESPHSSVSQGDESAYQRKILDKMIQYCQPKVECHKSLNKRQGQPTKKLVLSKIDKLRIYSETELRQQLCKEILENK